MLDSLKRNDLRKLEVSIERTVNGLRSGMSQPEFVVTTEEGWRSEPRLMITIDDQDQLVLRALPDKNGSAVMSRLDLLAASGAWLDGFPGSFQPGDHHVLGSVVTD